MTLSRKMKTRKKLRYKVGETVWFCYKGGTPELTHIVAKRNPGPNHGVHRLANGLLATKRQLRKATTQDHLEYKICGD